MKLLLTLILFASTAFAGNVDFKANKDGSISAQVKGGDSIQIEAPSVFDYTFTAGTFTSGTIRAVRDGKRVTLSSLSNVVHTNSASVSTAAILPEEFRPSIIKTAVYQFDPIRLYQVVIFATGVIRFDYRNWTGGSNATTTDNGYMSITYNID